MHPGGDSPCASLTAYQELRELPSPRTTGLLRAERTHTEVSRDSRQHLHTSNYASGSLWSEESSQTQSRQEELGATLLSQGANDTRATESGGDDEVDDVPSSWPAWRADFRRFFLRATWLHRLFTAAIFLNCVVLAFYDPLEDPTPSPGRAALNQVFLTGDVLCSVLFAIEMGFKIVALGIYGYMRKKWNIADGVIAICGVVSLFPQTGALDAVKLLRPLKLLYASQRMEYIMESLGESIPPLFYVAVMYFFFSLAMGIIGVQQWEGLFGNRCVLNTTRASEVGGGGLPEVYAPETVCKTLGNYSSLGGFYCPFLYDCVERGNPGHGWVGFDHIGLAMLTIFTAISLEGWTTNMYQAMNATTNLAVLYWLAVILLGAYFLMNLTLLIITETFNSSVERKKKESASLSVKNSNGMTTTAFYLEMSGVDDASIRANPTSDNHTWVPPWCRAAWGAVRRNALSFYNQLGRCGAVTRPQHWREWVNNSLLRKRWFQAVMVLAIIVNTASLAAEYHGQDPSVAKTIHTINIVLTILFTIEILLNLYVGMRRYIKDPFNILDVVVVMAGILEIITGGGTSVTALRSLRVLRVLRLATYFKQLQKWLHILLLSFQNVLYIVVLLLLLLYVGAIWGMRLFGGKFCVTTAGAVVAHNNTNLSFDRGSARSCPAGSEVPRLNYDTLHNSIVVTFQIITGENWNSIMYDAMQSTSWLAGVYCLVIFICGHYLILNLFVAALLCRKNGETLTLSGQKTPATLAVRQVSMASLSAVQVGEIRQIEEDDLRLRLLQLGVRRRYIEALGRGFSALELAESDDDVLKGIGVDSPNWRAKLLRLATALRNDPAGFMEHDQHVRHAAKSLHRLLCRVHADTHIAAMFELRRQRLRGGLPSGPSMPAGPSLNPLHRGARHKRQLEVLGAGSAGSSSSSSRAPLGSTATATLRGAAVAPPQVQQPLDDGCLSEVSLGTVSSRFSLEELPVEGGGGQPGAAVVGFTSPDLLRHPGAMLKAVASYADNPRLLESTLVAKYRPFAAEVKRALRTWVSASDARQLQRNSVSLKVQEILRSSGVFPQGSIQLSLGNVLSMVEAYEDSPHLLTEHLRSTCLLRDREVIFLEDWKTDCDVQEINYMEYYKMMDAFDKAQGSWFNTLRMTHRDRALFIFPCSPEDVDSSGSPGVVRVRVWLAHFRQAVQVCVKHTAFDLFIVVAIMVSTVCLAVDTPLRPPDHHTEVLIEELQLATMVVFAAETVLKSIAYGFVFNENAYLLRNRWNRLDFIITFTSVLGECLPNNRGMDLHRQLRMLRPLRFINRLGGVKVVFTAILLSLPPLMNVTVISLVVWMVFAIVGLQQFNGKFHACSKSSYGDMSAEFPTREACLNASLSWRNHPANFDNVGNAFLTLFQVASLEGWVEIMHLSVDAVSYDEAPRKDYNPIVAYYYILFVIFGSFVILNLFVGVLIDTFTAQKQAVGGSIVLSQGQERWVRTHSEMLEMVNEGSHAAPPDGLAPWRLKLHHIVTSRKFDLTIAGCIGVNVLVMALEHHPSSPAFDLLMLVVNDAILGVFAVEAIMKVVAFGPRRYLGNPWCRFDLTIVVVSTVPFILTSLLRIAGKDSSVDRINEFRALQLLRLLRMMRASRGVRRMLNTFLLSLPSLLNVSAVLSLLLFIYAVLGVRVFSLATWGEGIDRLANFTHFGPAILLLFRMTTGEDWHVIMYDCMATPEEGCEEHLGGCLPYWWGPLYFASFCLVGMHMLSNLFVAVVVDNFGKAGHNVLDDAYRTTLHRQWELYADGKRLPLYSLEKFLTGIGPPLGLYPDSKIVKPFIKSLGLNASDGQGGELGMYVHQSELYPKLFCAAFGTPLPEKTQRKLTKQQEQLERDMQHERVTPLSDVTDIVRVQALCRGFLTRCRMKSWKREYRKKHRWQTFQTDEGDEYYYDVITGVTTWEKPQTTLTDSELREWYKRQIADRNPNATAAADSKKAWPTPKPPTCWVQFTDDTTGARYYHDVVSANTTWDAPLLYCREI